MNELILTNDQVRQIAGEESVITVRTESGDIIGHFDPFSEAEKREVEMIKSRLGRPHVSYTKAQLLQQLESRLR